jgi:hypothetical protein
VPWWHALNVKFNNNNNNNNNNLKYKSLCIEIQRMWNLKCTIIPVIIGATGIIRRSLKKNLIAVPGKHSTDSLQKTAILGASHIIRKVRKISGVTNCNTQQSPGFPSLPSAP